jgi:hypothetical protein
MTPTTTKPRHPISRTHSGGGAFIAETLRNFLGAAFLCKGRGLRASRKPRAKRRAKEC